MRWWAPFSFALHIATVVFLVAILANYHIDRDLYLEAVRNGHTDALALAIEVGRLDLVSLLLTILGVLIGFGALFGFLEIRMNAQEVAREAATETAKAVATSYLNENVPGMIRAHVELLTPSPNAKATGDDVVNAMVEAEAKEKKDGQGTGHSA